MLAIIRCRILSSSLLTKNLKIKIHRNIILPVALYGYETWWLTLKEERRLRVFQNRVFRIIIGSKKDEVTGERRKPHNEEFNDLYHSPIIFRMIKSKRVSWEGHVACMGERKGVHGVLVRKPEGNRPLGRHKHRWEDNINMDLRMWDVGVWTGSIRLRIVKGGGQL